MTAVEDEHATVIMASEREVQEARENALRQAGLTLKKLQAQARTRHFESVRARLA
jgi:Tfp pilus assembly PilM family ATPase